MEAIECIKTRRSCRKYADRKVAREVIDNAIAAAAYAPSWKNTQVTRYIVVENEELKNKVADICCSSNHNGGIIKEAPVLIATTMVRSRSGYERDGSFSTAKEKGWQMFDCGIATQTLCLALHDAGVDTLIMGIFDIDQATELLGVPEDQEIAALIAVGYRADEEIPAPPKKTLEVLASYRD